MSNTLRDQAIDGLVTASAFHAGSVVMDGVPVADMPSIKKAVMCGLADLAAVKIIPMLAEHNLIPGDKTLNTLLKPAICGALYVLTEKYLGHADGRSTLTQFLHASGSSYAGAAVSDQVHQWLDTKPAAPGKP